MKTREEMKHRERVAVEKQILRNRLKHEEMDRWRETAAQGGHRGGANRRPDGRARGFQLGGAERVRGCGGCGCLGLIAALIAGGAIFGL